MFILALTSAGLLGLAVIMVLSCLVCVCMLVGWAAGHVGAIDGSGSTLVLDPARPTSSKSNEPRWFFTGESPMVGWHQVILYHLGMLHVYPHGSVRSLGNPYPYVAVPLQDRGYHITWHSMDM